MTNSKIISLWAGGDNSLHAKLSNGQVKTIAVFTDDLCKTYFEDLLTDLKQIIEMRKIDQ
jgi:hypothetical protein